MLPRPSVARYQRKGRLEASPRKILYETLTRRSRITNLGVFILIGFSVVSFLFNLGHWISTPSARLSPHHALQLATVQRRPWHSNLDHLIMVPCHAIWKGTNSWRDENDWILEAYQKGPGRVKAFYEHIARSAELATNDPHSLLIFSGGQTKLISSTTEAESYLRLAQTAGILPDQTHSLPFGRATTESYAMDSYQNLLFSIARFHEFTGHFPSKITVVGYEFKRPRFMELHRAALRWPEEKFEYLGVDPEHDSGTNAVEGELQNGYLPYTQDKYGCHSTLLNKRRRRNPYSRFHPYHASSPDLIALLDWCPQEAEDGESTLFEGRLPWDHSRIRQDS